jgi:hypothetical protein
VQMSRSLKGFLFIALLVLIGRQAPRGPYWATGREFRNNSLGLGIVTEVTEIAK